MRSRRLDAPPKDGNARGAHEAPPNRTSDRPSDPAPDRGTAEARTTSADETLSLPIQGSADLARVYQSTLQFAQKAGLAPGLQQELMTVASDVSRRIVRHAAEKAACMISTGSRAVRMEWHADRGKLQADSPAVFVGPVPARPQAGLVEPDASVSISGWRWLTRDAISRVSLVSRPHPREKDCGDMAAVVRSENKLRLVVADGLGHGPAAREAARRAVEALRKDIQLDLVDAVYSAHAQVAMTRGATLGVADIDLQSRIVRGTTVGNVRVMVFGSSGRSWSPCGTDAVLGHGRGNHGRMDVRVEQQPLPDGAIVCLFSDGLASQLRLPWQRVDLDDLAAQLFLSFSLPNDDATLLIAS